MPVWRAGAGVMVVPCGDGRETHVACEALAAAPLGLEREMVLATREDPGEHKYECQSSGSGLAALFTRSCSIVWSQYPGREACLRTLATVHGVAVLSVGVDSPEVTMEARYVG